MIRARSPNQLTIDLFNNVGSADSPVFPDLHVSGEAAVHRVGANVRRLRYLFRFDLCVARCAIGDGIRSNRRSDLFDRRDDDHRSQRLWSTGQSITFHCRILSEGSTPGRCRFQRDSCRLQLAQEHSVCTETAVHIHKALSVVDTCGSRSVSARGSGSHASGKPESAPSEI